MSSGFGEGVREVIVRAVADVLLHTPHQRVVLFVILHEIHSAVDKNKRRERGGREREEGGKKRGGRGESNGGRSTC